MNNFSFEPLTFVKCIVMCIMCILGLETFSIQVIDQESHQMDTKNRVVRSKNIHASRGQILDRNGEAFVGNQYDPNPADDSKYNRIFLQSMGQQIIGKVGKDGRGAEGFERVFDSSLAGMEGYRTSVQTALKREIYSRSVNLSRVEPGKNLVLTIDKNMQDIVERELKKGVNEFSAKSASAVVVDPYTGEILAMASYPTSKNEIVGMVYEPGSTFKLITASAALENGIVDTNKIYVNEGRSWKWNPKAAPIKDTHVYGDMNMSEAMVQSSNIVFAKIATEVGPEKMYRMARNYGIGMRTSAYFYGEESGRIKEPYVLGSNSGSDLKAMGFGHAVETTPIQMVMAYSAVANGGKLMEPMIVKEWRNSENEIIEKKEPVEVRRVISESTAAKIRAMLSRVVNNGTAKQVMSKKIPDLIFGGKTGTAEKFNKEKGEYDDTHNLASFVGLAPVENTRYVCMVLVDEPQSRVRHGGNTAGPIFRRIMEDIYYHPTLSPKSFRLTQVKAKSPCDADFMGMTLDAAKKLASERKCPLVLQGEGDRVISQRNDLMDSTGVVLTLGNAVASKMPNLKGLSLKDALDVMSNMRIGVQFEGKGRVVSQMPKTDEPLRKGDICKLILKEKG